MQANMLDMHSTLVLLLVLQHAEYQSGLFASWVAGKAMQFSDTYGPITRNQQQ